MTTAIASSIIAAKQTILVRFNRMIRCKRRQTYWLKLSLCGTIAIQQGQGSIVKVGALIGHSLFQLIARKECVVSPARCSRSFQAPSAGQRTDKSEPANP